MTDWIVILGLAALAGLALRHWLRQRKNGGCTGGCAGCTRACPSRRKEDS